MLNWIQISVGEIMRRQGLRSIKRASLVAQMAKNLPAMQETWVQSLDWEDSVEKEMAAYSSILPRESHGQRSLAGYSP